MYINVDATNFLTVLLCVSHFAVVLPSPIRDENGESSLTVSTRLVY